jgi:hypothetical protein
MAKKSSKSAAHRPPVRKKASAKKASSPPKALAVTPAPPQRSRFYKPRKHPVKLPTAWHITKVAADMLWQNRVLFIGITLTYGVLNLLFVQGLTSSTNINNLKTTAEHAAQGHFNALGSGLNIFVGLVGSGGNGSSQTVGTYQVILGLIASLAIIWALRQTFAGIRVGVRDAYYRGMYPLVPFLLVLLVLCIQLIPLAVGAKLYNTLATGGVALGFLEKGISLALFLALASWSLYMICSSVFALYITTLPDMTPVKALRSARGLVRYRRWTILRKALCLPVILFIIYTIIMVPIIAWATPLATWVFFLLTMFALLAIHSYMYTLYRELLNE